MTTTFPARAVYREPQSKAEYLYSRERLAGDPLSLLPPSSVSEYPKRAVIYDQARPSTKLYLVLHGQVAISRASYDGKPVVVDIHQADELFGEAVLSKLPARLERATAMESTQLMSWTSTEIENAIVKEPLLGVAIVQILAQRCDAFKRRVESFSADSVARRLARSMILFSEKSGTETENGSVRIVAFTHELLAQYVGTSREIVTLYMNQFRREGLLGYSRKGKEIVINPALRVWLRNEELARSAGGAKGNLDPDEG